MTTDYYAAGSLIIDKKSRQNVIVLFKKKNSEWYSLPFGKKEIYEADSRNTAIRETFEETGLVVNINNDIKPFIADKGNNKICHTWAATVNDELTVALQNLCDGAEGSWIWGPPELLVLGGGYKEYNYNMLKHFGYDIPKPSWKDT